MSADVDFVIRQFQAQDQPACKRLVQEGLSEHFGELRRSLNNDLNDIATTYTAAGHLFFIAEAGQAIIGTGAIVQESREAGRIVRLSVQKDYRRFGIARAILSQLISEAGRLRLTYINVETNLDWFAAINLYESLDFRIVGRDEESIHFQLKLP
jgi:ribosomal protein S18 acetylase RimI-like enzyme